MPRPECIISTAVSFRQGLTFNWQEMGASESTELLTCSNNVNQRG